jgi:beta-mannosidase
MWCGGNELQTKHNGSSGCGKPLDESHPMLKALGDIVRAEDPGRRYMATSASGPVFVANAADFGKGRHWDVHGPWRLPDERFDKAEAYWADDDALFRSETGAPGASSAKLIRDFAGTEEVLPISLENPFWRRVSWWVDNKLFIQEMGREPASLEEYVTWSQARQAQTLGLAVSACHKRFPAIGGIILWMGHDSFPCPANTSIIDFYGELKPAAIAVGKALGKKYPVQ